MAKIFLEMLKISNSLRSNSEIFFTHFSKNFFTRRAKMLGQEPKIQTPETHKSQNLVTKMYTIFEKNTTNKR